MEVQIPAHLTFSSFTGSYSFAELANNLHQQLALAHDVMTSNKASMDVIEQASAVAASSNFTSVTTQLADTNEKLGSHVSQTLSAIQTATTAIADFATAVESFETDFRELNRNIEVIREMSERVTAIARESTLLSINARIESAQAGIEGNGFTVVAEQVGSLAQTTQEISKQISDDVDTLYETLGNVSSRFTATRSSLDHAHGAIVALDEMAGGILKEAHQLDNITEEIEHIAYNQMEIRGHLERISRHSEWVKQSASALIVSIGKTSHETDRAWTASLPAGGARKIKSLKQFESQFARALHDDEPHKAKYLVDWALSQRFSPGTVLRKVSNAASRVFLKQVGKDFPTEVYFRNAKILQDAIERLEPLHTEQPDEHQPVVVLGNAYEDYHDLGRRIIAMAMRTAGFKVVDLGLSVSNRSFIDTARKVNADVIGVSSLLLHTAKWIPELKADLVSGGLGHVKLIAGGAPFLVDPHLRDTYKVDGVGRSPDDAIRLVKSFVAEKKLKGRYETR